MIFRSLFRVKEQRTVTGPTKSITASTFILLDVANDGLATSSTAPDFQDTVGTKITVELKIILYRVLLFLNYLP